MKNNTLLALLFFLPTIAMGQADAEISNLTEDNYSEKNIRAMETVITNNLNSSPDESEHIEWIWAASGGGTGTEYGKFCQQIESGEIAVIGRFDYTANFGGFTLEKDSSYNTFLTGITKDGKWMFANDIDVSGYFKLFRFNDNKFRYWAGYFQGIIGYDDKTFTSQGKNYLFLTADNNNNEPIWVLTGGSPGFDHVNYMTSDKENNLYISGYCDGVMRLGTHETEDWGGTNLFVAKINPEGEVEWLNFAAGMGSSEGKGIFVNESGELILTGSFSKSLVFNDIRIVSQGDIYPDIFVAKLNKKGEWEWATGEGGEHGEWGNGVCADPSGSIYVTGMFNGKTNIAGQEASGISSDIYIAKINPSLEWEWVEYIHSEGVDTGNDIIIDREGYIYVTGSFSNTINFGEHQLESKGNSDVFLVKGRLK